MPALRIRVKSDLAWKKLRLRSWSITFKTKRHAASNRGASPAITAPCVVHEVSNHRSKRGRHGAASFTKHRDWLLVLILPQCVGIDLWHLRRTFFSLEVRFFPEAKQFR